MFFNARHQPAINSRRLRHELKYVISCEQADALRASIASFCEFDTHGDEAGKYEVASVYYDTPDLRFFWDREESVGFRRKVRLRTYNQGGKYLAAFLESKEKHKHLVGKVRLPITDLSIVPTRFDNAQLSPMLERLRAHQNSAGQSQALSEFEYLNARLNLNPSVIIRYVREAWASRIDRDVRITFDSRLTAGRGSIDVFDSDEIAILHPNQVVLEIKATGQVPAWLQTISTDLGLSRIRFSKYCEAVKVLQMERLTTSSS